MSASLPVMALTILGALIAILGLFGAAPQLVVIGLAAIGFAGLLQVLGQRRGP